MKKRVVIIGCSVLLLIAFFIMKVNIHIRIILVLATLLYLIIDGSL